MDERDWTTIYRSVKRKPVFMKEGRPSSALFKDSFGVSVDRDMGRALKDIIEDEERFHNYYNRNLTEEEIKQNGEGLRAIISLTDENCDEAGGCAGGSNRGRKSITCVIAEVRDRNSVDESSGKGPGKNG